MNWKTRKRYTEAESADERVTYQIYKNRQGRFYVKAYLEGGAERRMKFQDFASIDDAKAWVENYEQERAERNARYAQEKPIRF